MSLKLITEENFELIESRLDETYNGPIYRIKGIIMQGNIKNRNGRIYPTEILARECARYNREYIAKNRALGELGHPDGPTVNLDRVSHLFEDLHQDGNNFIGTAKVLTEQPHGKMVAGFIAEGVKLGISTRGVGSIRNNGDADVVQDDFYLAVAGDIVFDPSAPDCFINGVMEGKEWVWNNGSLQESTIVDYKKEVDNAGLNVEESILDAFNNFMKKIS